MRYKIYFIESSTNRVESLVSEDIDQYETEKSCGLIWFKLNKPFMFIHDSRFNFWQQAWVNHQDRVRTIGVVPEEQVPDLVRMRHLIG